MQAKHSIRGAPIIGYEGERYYFAQKEALILFRQSWMILLYLVRQEKKRCLDGSEIAVRLGSEVKIKFRYSGLTLVPTAELQIVSPEIQMMNALFYCRYGPDFLLTKPGTKLRIAALHGRSGRGIGVTDSLKKH